MKENYDSLDVHVIHRRGVRYHQGGGKRERFTLDFLVNGQSLFETLDLARYDLVGRFSQGAEEWNQENINVFLMTQQPDLENGRTMIYVCPECGDIGCGAITMKIDRSDSEYTWSEFGYENNYDPEMTDQESYKNIGPFSFKFEDYRQVMEKAGGLIL